MRFLTHNSLRCVAKDATLGYPLKVDIEDLEVVEVEYCQEFLTHILPSLSWDGLKVASKVIGLVGFPDSFDESLLCDEDFLRAMHNLLLEVHIMKGTLTCPDTGRTFPIDNGIPNMKLPETEV
mmetsp:Transcript_10949/g.16494  ORF Transcript_10949/g.16494 Transcript_10949/m.16494 type:complete len:123 (-) Transcript_10949:757-1125(-)